jgi:hypothetical protein
MDSIIFYIFGQDLPQYHPPKADKSAGATGQAGFSGCFLTVFRKKTVKPYRLRRKTSFLFIGLVLKLQPENI